MHVRGAAAGMARPVGGHPADLAPGCVAAALDRAGRSAVIRPTRVAFRNPNIICRKSNCGLLNKKPHSIR